MATTSTAPAATPEQDRARHLARDATADLHRGEFLKAARALREAVHLAPAEPAVKDAFHALQTAESQNALVRVCREWARTGREEEGEQALALLRGGGPAPLSQDDAARAMDVLMDLRSEDDVADQVTGELLKRSRGARETLAGWFVERPHLTFEVLFERGDDSVNGLVALVLDPSLWPDEAACVQAQRDLFMLALAQMMEAGNDYPERAMKVIARMLAAQASHLTGIMDYDCFDVILSALDIRLSQGLRAQATLATAKLLELAPEMAQKLITDFVTVKVKKPTTDGLIIAFSAAAAIFPITPSVAATLFLAEGFLSNFVNLVQLRKSQRLEQAALELLSAACVDKTCRDAINKHCRDWINGIVQTAADEKRANLAGLVLMKLGEEKGADRRSAQQNVREVKAGDQDELIQRFKESILSTEINSVQESVEGLAYASLQPKIKENLAGDEPFVRRLIETMNDTHVAKPIMFGGLTILVNLTAYLPVQTEEEKKMAQLKAYAASQKPAEPDPLDDDAHVTARCKRVLDAGIVPLLVRNCKRASPSVLAQMISILLSLSKTPAHRGVMAQQGAVKLILTVWDSLHREAHPHPTSYGPATARAASHALARILISVNPAHVFSGATNLSATSAIRPLLYLLDEDGGQAEDGGGGRHRDLLPVFESLLALTNLASMDAPAPAEHIIRLAWPKLEDLCLSRHTLIQRATVELLCNLMASPHAVAKFVDDNAAARHRLHLLLALADAEDAPTRRAAAGALAMLTEWDRAADAVLRRDRDRGVAILLGLCAEESDELRHRGVVCVKNLVEAPGDVGVRARDALVRAGAVDVLREMVLRCKVRDVVAIGVEVLRGLVDRKEGKA